jgi:hypothetical protein
MHVILGHLIEWLTSASFPNRHKKRLHFLKSSDVIIDLLWLEKNLGVEFVGGRVVVGD